MPAISNYLGEEDADVFCGGRADSGMTDDYRSWENFNSGEKGQKRAKNNLTQRRKGAKVKMEDRTTRSDGRRYKRRSVALSARPFMGSRLCLTVSVR